MSDAYVHQPYPSMRYHRDHKPVTVADEAHEKAVAPAADGWKASPADVDEDDKKDAKKADDGKKAGDTKKDK
jgi:hypothetical protein